MLKQISLLKKLKYKTMMTSELKLIQESNDVVLIMRIFFHDKFKEISLAHRKLVIELSISSNFYSDNNFIKRSGEFVIFAANNLGKASFSKDFKDFITIH